MSGSSPGSTTTALMPKFVMPSRSFNGCQRPAVILVSGTSARCTRWPIGAPSRRSGGRSLPAVATSQQALEPAPDIALGDVAAAHDEAQGDVAGAAFDDLRRGGKAAAGRRLDPHLGL